MIVYKVLEKEKVIYESEYLIDALKVLKSDSKLVLKKEVVSDD